MPEALRMSLDAVGRAFIWGGLMAFALAVAFTVYAYVKPETLYGAHVPIAGFGLLGAGLTLGAGLRRMAKAGRRPAASNNPKV